MKTSSNRYLPLSDQRAEVLRMLLRDEMGISETKFDTGVPFIKCDMSSCRKDIMPGTAGDGKLEPGEIYEAAISLMEQEEDAFAKTEGKAPRRFTDLVAQKSDFRVPWLWNDFDPETATDDEILLEMAKMITDVRSEAAKEAKSWVSPRFREILVEKLVSRMRSIDGLALKPAPPMVPEETVLEMMAKPRLWRSGACTELSRVAYGLFRLAGLSPIFIEVQKNAKDPDNNNHMAVGVKTDPAKPESLTTVDMLYHGWISKEGHTLQSEMPAVTSLAAYYANRAHFEMMSYGPRTTKKVQKVEALIGAAIAFDPSFSMVRYNYADFLKNWKQDGAGAYREASKAVKLRPFDKDYKVMQKFMAPYAPRPSGGD